MKYARELVNSKASKLTEYLSSNLVSGRSERCAFLSQPRASGSATDVFVRVKVETENTGVGRCPQELKGSHRANPTRKHIFIVHTWRRKRFPKQFGVFEKNRKRGPTRKFATRSVCSQRVPWWHSRARVRPRPRLGYVRCSRRPSPTRIYYRPAAPRVAMDAGVAHMMPPPSPPPTAPRSLASTAPPQTIASLTE